MPDRWSKVELDRIGAADELQVAARRPDGSFDPYTTIWVVRVGDDLYVRSWRGARGNWYRRALRSGAGRIRSGGVELDVAFTQPDDAPHDAIDRGYRTKYVGYDPTYVEPMVVEAARAATLRLNPR